MIPASRVLAWTEHCSRELMVFMLRHRFPVFVQYRNNFHPVTGHELDDKSEAGI